MGNPVSLLAPPTMFDELPEILKQGDYTISSLSSDSVVRGIRRKDSACYEISLGPASVQLWLERRLGNPTMCISIVPLQKSFWRRELPSESLEEQIVKLLVAHGADSGGTPPKTLYAKYGSSDEPSVTTEDAS